MRDQNIVQFEDDRVSKVHFDKELFTAELYYVEQASDLGAGPKLLSFDRAEQEIVTERHRDAVSWFGLEPPQKIVRQVGERLLEKIQYLHESKICHRDIHIRNVIISDDDEPFIIDWEFALPVPSKSPCYDLYGPATGHPKPVPHRIQSSTETGVWWDTPMMSVKPLSDYFGELKEYL